MLRLTFGLGAFACTLIVWSCGSSNAVKTAQGEAGANAGGAAETAGGSGATSGTSAGSSRGGSGSPAEGGTSAEADSAGAPAGGAALGGGPALGGAPSSTEAGAAGANEGGAQVSASCNVDPQLCGEGQVCKDGRCENVAGTLAGLLWELPCSSDLGGNVCSTVPTVNVSTQLGGTPGTTYDVKLHFRGVVEQKTYSGGCAEADGYWLTGGATNGDSYNVYRLSISSPAQTFYLNRGSSNITRSWAIDFTQTIRIDAGATVTLFADSVDNQEIQNKDGNNAPLTVPGASVAQPYDGQFIQMNVESVQPDAVGSTSTIGGGKAGSALSFSGAQLATVADASSLQPGSSLTQEAWFNFVAPSGVYSSLFGKPVGAGSQDSFTIWLQDGSLHAGVGASSPSGAPALPWTTYNEWHHSALVYDGTAKVQTLYVDGLPVACLPGIGTVPYDSHALLLGADVDNGSTNGFFNGTLDELRLFSVARSADEIWADMHTHQLGARAGLVAEWTFDEGTGQVTSDSSGNGNSAVLGTNDTVEAADPSWVTSTVPH